MQSTNRKEKGGSVPVGDIILVEYEKMRETTTVRREKMEQRGLFLLVLTILLLVLNQLYTQNLFVQTGLNLFGLILSFLLFYCMRRVGNGKSARSLAEYASDMECMEKVLYCLDIDTYNKLGLVIDEVKARITADEQERERKEKIVCFLVIALAGTVSISCLCWRKGILSYVEIGSVLNFFLVVSALLFACAYVCARIVSSNRKYKWLYEILLNVMITKF